MDSQLVSLIPLPLFYPAIFLPMLRQSSAIARNFNPAISSSAAELVLEFAFYISFDLWNPICKYYFLGEWHHLNYQSNCLIQKIVLPKKLFNIQTLSYLNWMFGDYAKLFFLLMKQKFLAHCEEVCIFVLLIQKDKSIVKCPEVLLNHLLFLLCQNA